MPSFVQPTSYTARRQITLLGTAYAAGATVPLDVVRSLKDLSALVSSRALIPNADPHRRKTRLTTPAPVAYSPPSIRAGITDPVAPTPGTLAASAITATSFTLTVTGATDGTGAGLNATPYAFSTDNGATWSAWQNSPVYNASGLTAQTGYTCVHRVRDKAGNVATGASIVATTTA